MKEGTMYKGYFTNVERFVIVTSICGASRHNVMNYQARDIPYTEENDRPTPTNLDIEE